MEKKKTLFTFPISRLNDRISWSRSLRLSEKFPFSSHCTRLKEKKNVEIGYFLLGSPDGGREGAQGEGRGDQGAHQGGQGHRRGIEWSDGAGGCADVSTRRGCRGGDLCMSFKINSHRALIGLLTKGRPGPSFHHNIFQKLFVWRYFPKFYAISESGDCQPWRINQNDGNALVWVNKQF